jgi:ribosome-associated protein
MEEEISKSQKKRDAEALQKLGVKLVGWSMDKLSQLPLPDRLRQAIIDAKSLKSHGAVRRQAQLIGKLMRTSDLDAVYTAYEGIMAEDNAQTAVFHDVELWRDRFIKEDKEALTAFVDQYHPEDLQQLRQLIKKAVDEHRKDPQLHAASRALFRYLRSCIQ